MPKKYQRQLFILSYCFCASAFAANNTGDDEKYQVDMWQMCSDSRSVFNQDIKLPNIINPEQLDISAGSVKSLVNGNSEFEHDVLIEKEKFRLTTNKLTYNSNTSIISIPNKAHIETERFIFDSDSGEINNNKNSSHYSNVRFILQDSHLQGSAPEITIPNKDSTHFSQVNFSSCEPGKEAWQFSAKQLTMDHIDESGSARDIVLRVHDLPVFYLPYISFPLGERRRSGILSPDIKLSSSRNGFQLGLPYYWNIAPNQDATITPNILEKRGLLLQTHYRYLTNSSEGELDIEFLNNDKLTDEQRYLSKLVHTSKLTPNLTFSIDSTGVSDNDYLSDFGQSLELSSTSHLQQSASLQYRKGNWSSRLLGQTWQTIDDSIADLSKPYRRTPQITFNGTEPLTNNGLDFNLSGEWVNFTRNDNVGNQGYRSDLYPKLVWQQQGSYWFFKPSIAHRFTAYDITDDNGDEIILDDRQLSVFQMDSGLFFERALGKRYTQTLEPRLFYLNIPTVDQSSIPLFDTSESSFSFAQLFRDNRFNGTDRIGDANQITTALTTRIIDNQTGNERFSASIGQIHYFDDREVALSGNTPDTDRSSDIASELVLRNQDWSYRLSLLHDTRTNDVEKGNFLYHYQSDDRHIFNLGYRYSQATTSTSELDQSDISFKWPISSNWSVLARWNYSLTEEKDLEKIVGLEYNSCCWALRIVNRGYITQDSDNQEIYDRSLMFTLVLKGFGSTGRANSELERAILGFHPEY